MVVDPSSAAGDTPPDGGGVDIQGWQDRWLNPGVILNLATAVIIILGAYQLGVNAAHQNYVGTLFDYGQRLETSYTEHLENTLTIRAHLLQEREILDGPKRAKCSAEQISSGGCKLPEADAALERARLYVRKAYADIRLHVALLKESRLDQEIVSYFIADTERHEELRLRLVEKLDRASSALLSVANCLPFEWDGSIEGCTLAAKEGLGQISSDNWEEMLDDHGKMMALRAPFFLAF